MEDKKMTTLKHYCSDEIASALDAQLKDESFMGLYKQADVRIYEPTPSEWWKKGPTAMAFKTDIDNAKTVKEIDAIKQKYLGGGPLTSALAKEGFDSFDELEQYADAKAAKLTPAAEDGAKEEGCPEHVQDAVGCPACADPGLAVAVDFAIRHMVKIADALDQTGFADVASTLDEALLKLAAARPVVEAKKGKKHSYKEWVSILNKQSKKECEKFSKAYKSALAQAKKKEMDADKAEAYAVRMALKEVSKKYLKEPTTEVKKPLKK
jgi:hypothetical protein